MGCSVVLIVMLIIAGVNLLKRRDHGRVMSVRYAVTSIGMKLVGLVLFVIFVLPATARMNEAMLPQAGQAGSAVGAMSSLLSVIGMAATLIYPILVLVLVNSRAVKDYLRGR